MFLKKLILAALFSFANCVSYTQNWRIVETDKSQDLAQIKRSSHYRENVIKGGYVFYTTRSATDPNCYFGIHNNQQIILPEMFSNFKTLKNDSLNIILAGISKSGVFNLAERKWKIPLIYEKIEQSQSGLLRGKFGGQFDLYDSKFVELIAGFDKIENTSNEKYVVVAKKNGILSKQNLYDLENREFLFEKYCDEVEEVYNGSVFIVSQHGRKCFVDINNVNVPIKWYTGITPISAHVSQAYIVNDDGNILLLGKDFRPILKEPMRKIGVELLANKYLIGVNHVGKCGGIDLSGRVMLPFCYDKILQHQSSPLLITDNNEKLGVCLVGDHEIEEIVACEYDELKVWKYNFAVLTRGDKSISVIVSKKGVKLAKYNNLEAVWSSGEWYIIAQDSAAWYLLDRDGNDIGETNYEAIRSFKKVESNDSQTIEFLTVKKEDKWGIIKIDGTIVVEPHLDEIISRFGNFLVTKNGNYFGLYDLESKMILLPCEYDSIVDNRNGGFFVMKNSHFYVVSFIQNGDFKIMEMTRIN